VLLDARRPDLVEQWYAVMRWVRPMDLRNEMQDSGLAGAFGSFAFALATLS